MLANALIQMKDDEPEGCTTEQRFLGDGRKNNEGTSNRLSKKFQLVQKLHMFKVVVCFLPI